MKILKNTILILAVCCFAFSVKPVNSFSCDGWNAGYKMSGMNVYSGISVSMGVSGSASGPSVGVNGSLRWKRIFCCQDTSGDEAGSASACNFNGMDRDCLNVISYTKCDNIKDVTINQK